jgi:hypothetical protein
MFRRKNIVLVDEENKRLFVKQLDDYALKMQAEGWDVHVVGELKLMLGTVVRCSPPFGRNGRYYTAAHCVMDSPPFFADCVGKEFPIIKRGNVVEKSDLVPYGIWCWFQDCVNSHDYAIIDVGNEGDPPQLILSIGSADGHLAGYTTVPDYKDNPIGRQVTYTSYDYFDLTLKKITTKILGKGKAWAAGPNNQLYQFEVYYAYDTEQILARPGYSGSNVYVQ